jgi:hypothetical protein
MHKDVKKDARRTQKRTDDSFQGQTATRTAERLAIARAKKHLQLRPDAPENLNQFEGRISREALADPVQRYLERLLGDVDDSLIEFYTTFKRDGSRYQASEEMERNDWAYVHWSEWGTVVARFKCFFEITGEATIVDAQTHQIFTVDIEKGTESVDGEDCGTDDSMEREPVGRFALVEAFAQDYTKEPADGSLHNFQAHSASSLLYKMELTGVGSKSTLYVVDLNEMLQGPAVVIPFNPDQPDGITWLVVAPRWERMGIYMDNMTEFIRNDAAEKRKRRRGT